MGLFDAILGNASEVDLKKVQAEYEELMIPDEKIEQVYKLIRDLLVFTNKRLLLIDIQGITGKKIEYHSIPYKSIYHFSIESAGNFDLDAELKIWIAGMGSVPLEKKFNAGLDVYKLQNILASYIL